MKHIFSVIFALLLFSGIINAQSVERSYEALEYLQTNDELIYQGVHIPVLDIGYHEFSSDSITWRKEYVSGDCYMRFANTTSNTINPYTSKQGYHDEWFVLNICNIGGGSGTSQIDTIIVCSDGVCDTITTGLATVNIPAPRTITGSTTNTQTDTTHTHELILYLGEIDDVDTTGVTNGQVIKWNSVSKMWVASNDLTGTGAGGELTVQDVDGTPTVDHVTNIKVEDGHVTDNGVGSVTISFALEPVNGAQDFYRTDTVDVTAGDTFLAFSSPLPANDYIVVNSYALYPNGERQNLSYDSTAVDGFRVLDVIGESEVHYLVVRGLDSLFLAIADQGKVGASASDNALNFLDAKVDDTTITVINNELHVLNADSINETQLYVAAESGLTATLDGVRAHIETPHIGYGGAVITDLGNDSVAISAAYVNMKTSNLEVGAMKLVYVAPDTFRIPMDTNMVAFVDYNGGDPVYKVMESQVGYFYDNWDEVLFATIVNTGNRIIISNFKDDSVNPVYKLLLGHANTEPVRILGDGITVTDEGTRQFSTSTGAGLFGSEFAFIMPINTSSLDTFQRVYFDGTWQRIDGEQTVNNTQYNDVSSGLVSLTSGYFTNKWLYYVSDAPDYWLVLDGQEEYGFYSDAYEVTEPLSIPPELKASYAGAHLMGKFIVQEGRTEFATIQNPFEENYGVATVREARSYSFTSQGVGAGTFYIGGFYLFSAVDANLTQATPTQAYGTANVAYGAHPFIVAGGAGTVDAGVVGLRVTGTRIEDDGARTAGYADTIITDITSMTLNEYVEADKFIGTVTYQLIVMSGTPTTYSFDFNYGGAKYEDFQNRDYDVVGLEVIGTAGATDTNFNITLIHHNAQDWTYAATGFTITPTVIADLQTIYNTEYQIANGAPFAFKRTPMNYEEIINGSQNEGVIIRIVTTANNSVQSLDAHLNVRIVE